MEPRIKNIPSPEVGTLEDESEYLNAYEVHEEGKNGRHLEEETNLCSERHHI